MKTIARLCNLAEVRDHIDNQSNFASLVSTF